MTDFSPTSNPDSNYEEICWMNECCPTLKHVLGTAKFGVTRFWSYSSEHDRRRTDGGTQDSIKKCPKHAEKHSRTTRSSYRP
ncbi:hypothetical protein EMCRGX_G002219 [Ephydatia muelleri]